MLGSPSKTIKYCDIAFLLCFAAGLCFLIWRAPFGFADSDEAFYLTVPYRLTMGDALIADEWHVSQLAGFLLLPAMRLYLLFSSGTEGMLLFFRYLCVAAQGLSALFVYLRLRRLSPWGGLFAALTLLLYVPFNISALSYNSMGILLMGSACVVLATAEEHMRRDMLLAGLLFAGAVLCCPHLVLLYAPYSALMLGLLLRRRHGGKTVGEKSVFDFDSWLFFSLGAAALALVFLLFLLSRADIRTLVNSVLVIFIDPEHSDTTFFTKLFSYFESLFIVHDLALPALCACGVLLAAVLFDKESRGCRRSLYVLAAAAVCAVYYAPFLFEGLSPLYLIPEFTAPRYVNFIMFPFNILGLFAYLLSRERQRKLFATVYIPGLVYSFCVHLSSNQLFYNIASVAAVSLLASVVFIVRLISELSAQGRRGKLLSLLLSVFIVAQLAAQVCFRADFVYEEAEQPSKLTHTVSYGPEKGVRTTEEKAETLYYDIYEATQSIREKRDGKVLYYSERTWLYLADSKASAAYSAWLSFLNPDHSLTRLLYYWSTRPAQQADYIFVSKDFENAAEYAAALNLRGLPVTETPLGYIIGS